jgi:predicted nucleic acid-binding protein
VATVERIDRVFLDAGFIIASSNSRDQHYRQARDMDVKLLEAREIWTTDAVLLEIAASLARPPQRNTAVDIWDLFHGGDSRYRSVESSAPQLLEAMDLYRSRQDKEWSLMDCLSFIVMEREGLVDALTADQHFEQAGFRALLLLDG